ncbi:GIY-YIG nuclease family protein [Aestuariivivens marinum]|uniref:GIY-YIG nuclease family protein n=1 Tax=Aestuariivivens marinum TaxID=2913555 RepID=UPI001F5ADB6A|nr:GIY-YIG nuclease family protein [Aestuariivivens marinum]
MLIYYVYILQCKDGSYYTGITSDLEKRFAEHQSGFKKDSYTCKRRPLTLEFYQEFNDVEQAIYFIKKIKKWTKAKKEALIKGDFNMLQILSESRNATHFKYR